MHRPDVDSKRQVLSQVECSRSARRRLRAQTMGRLRLRAMVAVLWLSMLAAAMAGCSIVKIVGQPATKEFAAVSPGSPRSAVLEEFGKPVHSDTARPGRRIDVFSFDQAHRPYNLPEKAAMTTVAASANLLTIGAIEMSTGRMEDLQTFTVSLEVVYDAQDRVISHRVLKGRDELVAMRTRMNSR